MNLDKVWPTYLRLFELLSEKENNFIDEVDGRCVTIRDMKKIGREYMNKNCDDFSPTFYHKACSFLNPNMKKLKILDQRDQSQLHEEIESFIAEKWGNSTPETVLESPAITERSHNKNHTEDLLDIFCSFDDESFSSQSEMTKYINHPIKNKVNPVHWWLENHKLYPN